MVGPDFRDFVSQEQSQSSKILKKSDSRDSGNESQDESEVSGNENQEIPNISYAKDVSLENEILANFPNGCDRSLTVELKDEDLYDIIPKSLTFAEITNILNQAQEDNCEKLDEIVQDIEDYEGRSITLDNVNLKSFCEQQLNLDLRDRSDHQHIYSNILSQYNFDQENFKCDYSLKELVLLAIAANDKLVEQYQVFLFAEGNLSLLPLLVGGQKYIEAFIEKFHGTDGVYGRLKDQAIQLVEPNKVGFFSIIALRKEQKLLETVLIEYVLRDLEQVLKTSKPDPLYGVLETASLVKNEEFITIVLGAFERYINEPTKKASTKELLKKSFATLLETGISQEHTSVIEYLCKRYTNSAGHAIYDVYEQAFADGKVITILRQQILKNIGARGRKEIYDLVLKTALDAGNVTFIEHLCKECAECSNDVIGYLNQKFKNNEFDNIHESILIALSNVEGVSTVINELPVLSQVVNEKNDDQSENPGLESAGSKQTEKNIVDNEKDVMNSGEALEKKPIGNNCEEDEVSRGNGFNNQRSSRKKSLIPVRERSNGTKTSTANTDEFITTENQPNNLHNGKNARLVQSTKQGKGLISKIPCLQLTLTNGNNSGSQKFNSRKSSSKQPQENIVDRGKNIMNNGEASEEKSISNSFEEGKMGGSSKKKGLRLLASPVKKEIDEIISKGNDNLEEKLKNTLRFSNLDLVLEYAKSQEGRFKDKVVAFLTLQKNKKNGAQINGKQSTNPHNGSVAEPFVQSAPSKNASSGVSNVPKTEDVTNSKDMPVINGASSKDDCEFENDEDVTGNSDDKRGDSPSGSGSSSPIQDIVNEKKPVVIITEQLNDGEHDKTVSKGHQDDALEKDLIDFSSDDDNSLLGDQVPTSAPPVTSENSATLNSPQPPVADNKPEQVNDTQTNDGQPDNQNNTALPVQPTTPETSNASSDISDESEIEDGYSSDDSSVSVVTVKGVVKQNGNENGRQPDNQNNTALPVQSMTPEMPNAFSDVGGESKTTEPVVTATNSDDKHSEVSSITSNDPLTEDDEKEPLLNGKGNSKQLSDPGKNNTAPQNTKSSNWPTVATWMFAVAGILAGAAAPAAYFAFSVSLLTTGIIAGVAACCLIAAIVTYCYSPKTLIENDKVKGLDDMQKSTSCCS